MASDEQALQPTPESGLLTLPFKTKGQSTLRFAGRQFEGMESVHRVIGSTGHLLVLQFEQGSSPKGRPHAEDRFTSQMHTQDNRARTAG